MILALSELTDLPKAAQSLLDYASGNKIFLFKGDMGAGKTTFIKAICSALGVKSPVNSPTFALVNEYEYPGGLIYHFDCYRLKTAVEALDMGFEEYVASGAYCFIEWPEKIEGLWPEKYVLVSLQATDAHTRQISVETIA